MTAKRSQNDLDRATQARLSKLASRPVDTTAVSSRLRTKMIRCRADNRSAIFGFPVWARWVGRSAIAASLLVAVTLLFVMSQSGSTVYAAPAEMVRLHRDLVAGRAPVVPVANLAEAKKVIDSKWREAPAIPDQWDHNVHACCLRDVQSRQVACILMKQDNVPVTVVLARTKDFRSPDDGTVDYHGHKYAVLSRDGVNMVMTQQGARWMCLMGELSQESLLRIADNLVDNGESP
ncbi:MAG: hypothetical protein GC162_13985 [Planctomycetes bacterium]|nr:hypothetical protein [Planctomycetota bacterium]